MASHGPDISLAYLLEFVAKTESGRNPLPRSLEEFVGDLPEERLLCPVWAVRAYLGIMASIALRPRSLLISPRHPTLALSKNAMSFFLRQVILDAGAVEEGALPPCAHSVRAVATSAAFLRNLEIEPCFRLFIFPRHFVFS